jgi:hypothetical protein
MQPKNKRLRPSIELLETRRLLSTTWGDYNGDGFSDLAVGVPGDEVGTAPVAGAVNVIYGSASGLTSANNQLWHQDVAGILDTAEIGDQFGNALAAGDFDNDGFADLAIGAPGEGAGFQGGAGAVHILYGSSNGLDAEGNQVWSQDSPRIRDIAEAGDRFGASVISGDLNGDGFDDLAIGVPLEDIGPHANAGTIHILYGSSTGIKPPGNLTINLDTPGVEGVVATDDQFGFSFATGDFTGDGFEDLAVGVPRADGGSPPQGAVSVFYGSMTGLAPIDNSLLSPGLNFDAFGFGLAAGDFTGDGKDDLAVGSPGFVVDGELDAGAVYVLFGNAVGLTLDNSARHVQSDVPGDVSKAGELWGMSLAVGDVDDDGFSDLAVAAPFANIRNEAAAGLVNVLHGTSGGLATNTAATIVQETVGGGAKSEFLDVFGGAITAGDYDGDGQDDLAIAAATEDIGSMMDVGTVYVVYGPGFGNGQAWNQDSPGIEGVAAAEDRFGTGLGSGPGRSFSGREGDRTFTIDETAESPPRRANQLIRPQANGLVGDDSPAAALASAIDGDSLLVAFAP